MSTFLVPWFLGKGVIQFFAGGGEVSYKNVLLFLDTHFAAKFEKVPSTKGGVPMIKMEIYDGF